MLQIIGAGFGRTGTHSLGLAIEKLGLGPCYHTYEIAKNLGHRELWAKAIAGRPVDWDALFTGYRSAVEWPAVAFFPEIIGHYPQARVVLTLRDPESWYESAQATILEALELSTLNPDPVKRERSRLMHRLVLEHTFAGRYRDKAYAIKVYQRHIQNVVEIVPAERLLQYYVKDGWEPLCKFLDKPVPAEPFPRLNERADFIASAPDWAKKLR
jgi:hypothetical protein